MGWKFHQKDGGIVVCDGINTNAFTGTRAAVAGVSAKHVAFGPFVQTTLTFNEVAQAVVDGTEYQGTKVFTFPETRMWVVGAVATLRQKTTSAIATTLNSGVTGAVGLGTATASATTLATTMQDIIPTTAYTTSTVINTAGTAVTAVLAAAAFFDGTGTAKDLYLNTAYATTGDIDGNATQTISGSVVITWINLGDK